MEVYRNKARTSCLGRCRLSLVVSHLRTPILNCFYYLLWFYLLTDSEFSCLAKLTKPCHVSDLTYWPQIPNQLYGIPKGAHEVLETNAEARHMSGLHIKIISFVHM